MPLQLVHRWRRTPPSRRPLMQRTALLRQGGGHSQRTASPNSGGPSGEGAEGQGLTPLQATPARVSTARQEGRDAMPGMDAAANPRSRVSAKRQLTPQRNPETVRQDLTSLLQGIFKVPNNSQKGYQLAFLKGDFLRKHGYPLDHEFLGFHKLKGLLLDLPALVHVTSAPGGHGIPVPRYSLPRRLLEGEQQLPGTPLEQRSRPALPIPSYA